MNEYVIIGNGVAAAACIEGIRSIDTAGSVTVISSENHPVYCRPLISYYLEGKTDKKRMLYRGIDFYKSNNCTVLFGKTAQSINKNNKTVLLDDGTVLPYTKLCIAAGSSPFVPPVSGLDSVVNCFPFMTFDDAEALKNSVAEKSKVLIIGAGLIGLKCAEGLRSITENITVCDLSDRILSSILDSESAALVQKHLENRGIRFLLSDSAERFENGIAHMKSGAEVSFDILVPAVGVKPNVGLMRDIGGETNRGIIVDDQMRTGIDSIFAAGDCTEGTDITIGEKRVLALLPNAYQQGFCAGANMAGGQMTFDKAIPMNSIGFFGLHMMTAGTRFDSEHGGTVYEENNGGSIKKLFCRDGFLTGFILVDDTARAGIFTAMIRDKVPIDSVDFKLLIKNPTSIAFSKEKRKQMFGGVV